MNRPKIAETGLDKLRSHEDRLHSGVELLLGLSRHEVADRLKDAAVIEPVYLFDGGIFHRRTQSFPNEAIELTFGETCRSFSRDFIRLAQITHFTL